jgi:hypothetical protein
MRKIFGFTLVVAVLMLFSTSAVFADCITGGKKTGRPPLAALMRPGVLSYGAAPQTSSDDSPASIVGMWTVTFLIGEGPQLYDQAFEQFHADGNEFANDIAVPPAAGNICLGIWESTGPRSIKLHHLGWNWDTSVNPAAPAGVFVLNMTVTVSRDGKRFSGRYVTDSLDTDGNVIPAFHGEGVVNGQRVVLH